MFYALAEGKIDTGDITYVHELQDIESLNQRALARGARGDRGIDSRVRVSERAYALLPHGASMGDRYGPRLVAREPMTREDVRGQANRDSGPAHDRVSRDAAVPARFRAGDDAVRPDRGARDRGRGRCGAAHPRRAAHVRRRRAASHSGHGRVVVSARPGCRSRSAATSCARISATELIGKVSRQLRASIAYGLDHRKRRSTTRCSTPADSIARKADEFVGMYVNDWTLDYGERGRAAVRLFLDRGVKAGIITRSSGRRVRRRLTEGSLRGGLRGTRRAARDREIAILKQGEG